MTTEGIAQCSQSPCKGQSIKEEGEGSDYVGYELATLFMGFCIKVFGSCLYYCVYNIV